MAAAKKKTTKVAKASKKAPAKKGAAKAAGRAKRALSSKQPRKVAIRKVKTKTGKKRADSIKIADHTSNKKRAAVDAPSSASRIPHKKELEAKVAKTQAEQKKNRKISKPIKGLSVSQPERELEKLSEGWELNKNETQISKLFEFPTFISALAFVAKITVHAEVLQHHPDIELSYGKVKVKLTTHSVDALTKHDFALAERIDGISLRM